MAKRKFELYEGWYRVDALPVGELVKRSPASKKVYVRKNYDRLAKAYELDDYDDISRQILVRGSTKVWAGFTF